MELSKIQESFKGEAAFEIINVAQLGHFSVIATKSYKKGDRVGVFSGTFIDRCNIPNRQPKKTTSLEIIVKGKVIGLIDGSQDPNNWVKYIAKARNVFEQNINIMYRKDLTFEFVACRDIFVGQEFLAWFHSHEWFDYLCSPGDNFEWPKIVILGVVPPSTPWNSNQENHTPASKNTENLSNINQQNEPAPDSFKCTRCGNLFSSESYLTQHMTHTSCVDASPDRIFGCHLCPRKFDRKQRLRVHIVQVHYKKKPYKCKECNKEFSQSSSLTKHTRTHTRETPYKCTVCKKQFSSSSILKTHTRKHTGEKPFRCKFCYRDFHSHAAHHNHVRSKHNVDPVARVPPPSSPPPPFLPPLPPPPS